MSQLRIRVLAGCGAFALAAASLAVAPALSQSAGANARGKVEVKVLSSRYDLVSGGDALVEVRASEGAKANEFWRMRGKRLGLVDLYLNGQASILNEGSQD